MVVARRLQPDRRPVPAFHTLQRRHDPSVGVADDIHRHHVGPHTTRNAAAAPGAERYGVEMNPRFEIVNWTMYMGGSCGGLRSAAASCWSVTVKTEPAPVFRSSSGFAITTTGARYEFPG